MKKYNISSHGGYSIIAAIMMIGFLLVLTTSTLNLVLQEMQDGKGRQDYMKAYSAAEGAVELALYKIKEHGYGYDDIQENLELFGSGNKEAKINYDFDSQVSEYVGGLEAYQTDIIPLFWIDSTGVYHEAMHPILSDTSPGIIWNILGESGGISATDTFGYSDLVGYKTVSTYNQTLIKDFLLQTGYEYLILYNPTSLPIQYKLEVQSGEYFTKPEALIYGSAKVGKYTQNIRTSVNNTEFLGILKYSIYSGN